MWALALTGNSQSWVTDGTWARHLVIFPRCGTKETARLQFDFLPLGFLKCVILWKNTAQIKEMTCSKIYTGARDYFSTWWGEKKNMLKKMLFLCWVIFKLKYFYNRKWCIEKFYNFFLLPCSVELGKDPWILKLLFCPNLPLPEKVGN